MRLFRIVATVVLVLSFVMPVTIPGAPVAMIRITPHKIVPWGLEASDG